MDTMFFGEIVDPRTRALVDDEFENFPDEQTDVTLKLPFLVPKQIDNLLVIETKNGNEDHHYNLFHNYNTVDKCKNPNIEILCNEESNYVIKWSPTNENTSGEVVHLFKEWIKLANHVYSITISSIGIYRNYELTEKPPAVIRILTNDKKFWPYKTLEPPNLVSDLPANILSFCIHCDIKCTLFIIYTDLLPCDSLNTEPLVNVLNQLNFQVAHLDPFKPLISSGNLYD